MGIPVSMTVSLAAASATNIAASQSPAAGAILINGTAATAGVATLDTQRHVIVTSGGDDTGITFTISGTNGSGTPISQTITGANAGAATTTLDFKTVSSVTHTGSVASTVTVGTNGVGSSPWKLVNYHVTPVNIGIGMIVTGTINYTFQYTTDPDPCGIQSNGVVTLANTFDLAALASKSTTLDSSITTPITAWRVTINSGTGSVKANVVEGGLVG